MTIQPEAMTPRAPRTRKKTALSIVGVSSKATPLNTVMMKQEFRKHVAAIHTSGELSLLERKLANVLLLNAYDNLRSTKEHKIPVKLLCVMVGWEESQDIQSLKKALRKIVTTAIEFNVLGDQANEKWAVGTLLAYADIQSGVCTYEYSSSLAEKLADPDIYAIINMSVQRLFKGSYSLTLYENCVRFKKVGSTGWIPVDVLRKLLGADSPMYEEFKHFNNHCLKRAVDEINQVSDLRLVSEFQRGNRKVTHIRFQIFEKNQKSLFEDNSQDFEEFKNRESFKRLISHGIGEKLALSWVMQDEEKVLSVMNYVEEKDRRKAIKSVAGYIRKMFEDPEVSFDKTEHQKNRELEHKRGQDEIEAAAAGAAAESEASKERAQRADKMIAEMPLRDLNLMVENYKKILGPQMTSSYNPETGAFKKSLERMAFKGWLHEQIKQFSGEE